MGKSRPDRSTIAAGFTLVEVIITMTILAFISIFLAQSMQSALSSKKKIQGRVDRDSKLRDALSVLRNDIKLSFNYRDINVELYNEAQKEREKRKKEKKTISTSSTTTGGDSTSGEGSSGDGSTGSVDKPDTAATNTEENKPFVPKEQKIYTQFQGQADNLHFTSLSLPRVQANAQTSNQSEVSYFLKDCRGRLNKDHQSKCLWRRTSAVIDEDLTTGGNEMALLEDVTEFKLRYLGPGTEGEWRDDWMSGEGGDAITKNKFPDAVEISIEVQDKDTKENPISMTVVAPIRFPNNPNVLPTSDSTSTTEDSTDDSE